MGQKIALAVVKVSREKSARPTDDQPVIEGLTWNGATLKPEAQGVAQGTSQRWHGLLRHELGHAPESPDLTGSESDHQG